MFAIVEGFFYSIKFYFELISTNDSAWVRVGLFNLKFQPAPDFRKTVPETIFSDHKENFYVVNRVS